MRCTTAFGQLGGLGTQTHGAAFFGDVLLLVEQADYGVVGVFVELGGVCGVESDDIAGELDHGTLHPETDPKERHASLARPTDGLDFAFNPAFAKAAGDQNPVVAGEQSLGTFALDFFAVNTSYANLHLMVHCGVVDRFVNGLVGVAMLGVFADNGDADFALGIA